MGSCGVGKEWVSWLKRVKRVANMVEMVDIDDKKPMYHSWMGNFSAYNQGAQHGNGIAWCPIHPGNHLLNGMITQKAAGHLLGSLLMQLLMQQIHREFGTGLPPHIICFYHYSKDC